MAIELANECLCDTNLKIKHNIVDMEKCWISFAGLHSLELALTSHPGCIPSMFPG